MKKYLDYDGLLKPCCNYHKLLLTMKIIFLLLFCGLVNLIGSPTYSQNTKISLSLRDVTIEEVLNKIESESEFYFLFNQKLINVQQKVNIEADQESIKDILDEILSKDMKYVVYDRQIIITPSTGNANYELFQQKNITGVVKDKDGNPLPGVNVLVSGTTVGAITDIGGNYSIAVPTEGASLTFSFIGYESQVLVIGTSTKIDATLSELLTGLEEVVVIGYGTQRKRDITGSVASITSKEISTIKVSSFDRALQGKASGVLVTQSSGLPGSPPAVQIRGAGRFGTSEPLYIIDNIIIQGNQSGGNTNPLAGLNPDDIQSIEILKDAGAAAIYGARAGNGVVIITTKKGVAGKMKVTLDAYYGSQSIVKKLPMLNTNQFFDYYKANTGNTHAKDTPANRLLNYDWQDLLFNTAPHQNYTLNISGGSENATYSVSQGYSKQDGILIASGFERYSVRAVVDFKLTKSILVGQTLNYSRSAYQINGDGTGFSGPISNGLKLPNYIAPYSTDPAYIGGYFGPDNLDAVDKGNPLTAFLRDYSNPIDRLLSTTYGQVEILKGLKYKINIGADIGSNFSKTYTPIYYAGPYDNNATASLGLSGSTSLGILIENTLNYTKDFNKHHIDGIIGASQQKNTSNWYSLGTRFDNSIQRSIDAASTSSNRSVGGNSSYYLMRSQFGRLNYNYDGKYLLSATVRRDGSSRFGANKRYGVFPAFSLGWRLSKEDFLSGVSFISDLKLYGSWGQLGNDAIANYLFASNVLGKKNYIFLGPSGDVYSNGYAPEKADNPDLQWELTATTNVGLSGSLLNDKISFEIEYYSKKTDNLLLASIPLPSTVGLTGPASNQASILNQGLDLSAGYRQNQGEFTYSITGNMSLYLNNEVLSVGESNTPIYGGGNITPAYEFTTKSVVGGVVGGFFGYKMIGIWQQGEEAQIAQYQAGAVPGDIRFEDVSGPAGVPDGKITADDQTFIGNPNPKFAYGATLSGDYKGFDLSVFFQGVYGNDIYNFYGKGAGAGISPPWNVTTIVLDAWTPENKSNTRPRVQTSARNFVVSSIFLEKGSYARLKNLQLGYTLPLSILKYVKLSNLRLYVNANNLLTFTKYTGYDPEVGAVSGNNTDKGVDKANYPSSREIIFGIQVGF
jgi:TonB-linked SusC/RagA family outer membrane protein